MRMRRMGIGLMCVISLFAVACTAGGGAAVLTGHQAQTNRDPARWHIYVPPGWHVVRFSDAKGGVRSAGIQLSNVRLPAPTLHPGTRLPIQVNGEVLPSRGVGLIVATDTDPSLSHGKESVPPLPLPWPDGSGGSRGWIIASAPPRAPVFEWLWLRAGGTTYVAAVAIGWKASRADQRALAPIVRSIKP